MPRQLTLTDNEMQTLAEKLVEMPFKKAVSHVRHLDPQAHLQLFRVGVGNEIQTKYRLPGLGVVVTLIEEVSNTPKREDSDKLRAESRLVEARVEALA